MKKRYSIVLSSFLASVIAMPAAFAGIVDSPISFFPDGTRATHRFSVPGVIANQGGLQTVFMCTSMERTRLINIGVEVFDTLSGAPLNDISAGNGHQVLNPGQTMTLETNNSVSATFTSAGLSLGGGLAGQGSARIVSTSGNIICTAIIMSQAGTPPTSMAPLTVIKKRKQKGD